ncbi:MAG: DUF1501 domain-containing protein [Halieaceae bacterium]|jgi:hypothetical protein|nr:DUF1501 domain-containing protein [Halieaceae bacterium]
MKHDLTRRRLLTNALLATSGAALGSSASSRTFAASDDYKGPLLVTLQLDGGVDVTSWCDPKVNTPGEPKINYWADDAAPLKARGITYAPYADNERLFGKYARDMLVVNGVDAQTNAHSTGILFNWSGRNSSGAPSLTALHAAKHGKNLPLAYTSLGGFSATANLTRFTRMWDITSIKGLLDPFSNEWDGQPSRAPRETELIRRFVDDSVDELAKTSISRRQLANLAAYREARANRGSMTRLFDILPPNDEFEQPVFLDVPGGAQSDLKRRMQGVLLIFKAGLGTAADLSLQGFDSHNANDAWQVPLLTHVTDALDFFWSYAQELGIANRITLLIGSDFGRTNFYNDSDGKDHWNIGSYIVMSPKAPWGGRVVGATDELHFARPINPKTLKPANNGIVMTPSHVHLALRRQLGLERFANDAGFPLDVEAVDMFNRNKRTVG